MVDGGLDRLAGVLDVVKALVAILHAEKNLDGLAFPWGIDGVLVYVDDIDLHFEQARAAGATLLSGIESGPEDSRLYRAEDLEGHRWMFMQSRA